jgi:hypothetical protein
MRGQFHGALVSRTGFDRQYRYQNDQRVRRNRLNRSFRAVRAPSLPPRLRGTGGRTTVDMIATPHFPPDFNVRALRHFNYYRRLQLSFEAGMI